MEADVCTKCLVLKDVSLFYVANDRPKGHRGECKECTKAWINGRYVPHPRVLVAERKRTPLNYWVNFLRHKKNKGINVSLTKEEYLKMLEAENCPICGIVFTTARGNASLRRGNRSIDRIDPDGEYSAVNCACVCMGCNITKNNGTAELHSRIAEWMISETKKRSINATVDSKEAA